MELCMSDESKAPEQTEEPHLIIDRDEHIVTVTLNRPKAKNAFTLEMLARLWDAWQMIDEDPNVRCAILTGAGGDFCAGADLKMMHGSQEDNPWFSKYKEDPDLHWKALLRSRAIENQAYVVGVNRVGEGDSLSYQGDSAIIDPLGEVIKEASSEGEEILIADIEPERVSEVRKTFPFINDRSK